MNNKNIALLIDCDNTSRDAVEPVLNELAKYGVVNVRRAYGDWKSEYLKNWEETSRLYALKPVQQFAYTRGKNATDAAVIIDAMDILYTKQVDCFALMSSDSDFTPLVVRLLESGKEVYGFGAKKTPVPFVKACTQFIFTEDLVAREKAEAADAAQTGSSGGAAVAVPRSHGGKTAAVVTAIRKDAVPVMARKTKNELRGDAALVRMLRMACANTADDDGWSPMSQVTLYINNLKSHAVQNYGFSRWSVLIEATELFDVERRSGAAMFIRDRRSATAEQQRDKNQKEKP